MHDMFRNRSLLKPASVVVDLVVLVVGFFVAHRIRLGQWDISAYGDGLEPVIVVSVAVYSISLLLSGIYSTHPRDMHLKTVWTAGIALTAGWAVSVLVRFLISPSMMAPRTVYVVHWMLSLIGVLAWRGLLRQFFDSTKPSSDLRPIIPEVSIDDVLGQKSVVIDRPAIQKYLSGRTVLVTGAGGSIGAELTKLLVELKPFRLVLVDVSEYALFQLEERIKGSDYSGELVFRIADIRDVDIMRSIFESTRPDVVFHAAAYKHVPLMERHPIEAFRNNSVSTVSLIRLCEQFETEQFIFVSTDKVVDPSSVLGATKRLGEWYVRVADSTIRRKIVRFGNVFGTQGSVVELFAEQIAMGGPVKVTHPDMERYFMSRHDACALILQTMLFEEDSSTYMLRMGSPVSIVWLAERMIELYGRGKNRIQIEFTGVRPGEKITEQLRSANEIPHPTAHESIVSLSSPAPFSRTELDTYLAHLETLAFGNHPAELRKALFKDASIEMNVTSQTRI
jgi:FlaA1/EpsC-like NDP-sugar epimerase